MSETEVQVAAAMRPVADVIEARTSPEADPAPRPEKGPEKEPEKGPERGPEKVPEKVPEKGPEKGLERTPEKAPVTVTERAAEKADEKMLDASPGNAPPASTQTRPETQREASREPKREPVPAPTKPFSWLDPHPIFVIIFVGSEERPFGIQKDFLCAKSQYFRDRFYGDKSANGTGKSLTNGRNGTDAPSTERGGGDDEDEDNEEKTVEHVVHLPDVAVDTFAYVQHYLYTGQVVPPDEAGTAGTPAKLPSYDLLIRIWKLGHRLGIDGLCSRTLEAMAENRRLTQTIPATPILVQVWKDTPERSSIRQLLLSWAAEYLRSSEGLRAEFAKALPQELLSELVVAMSSSYGDYWAMGNGFSTGGSRSGGGGGEGGGASARSGDISISTTRSASSSKHYLNGNAAGASGSGASDHGDVYMHDGAAPAAKRPRYFEPYPPGSNPSTPHPNTASSPALPSSVVVGRKANRTSLPSQRVFSTTATATAAAPSLPKKRSHQLVDMDAFSPAQKLRFCNDLLTRMLSGPGFWTRLVGPFREPVDPSSEGIPDYFDKVKRPMDLGTIKANLDNGRYTSHEEFAADMRQIFSNVYTYWKKGDSIWQVCERLEKTFEEKYSQMNKWLGKLDGDEMA